MKMSNYEKLIAEVRGIIEDKTIDYFAPKVKKAVLADVEDKLCNIPMLKETADYLAEAINKLK